MSEQVTARRKPEWLKIRLNTTDNYHYLKRLMRSESLHTVCRLSARMSLFREW